RVLGDRGWRAHVPDFIGCGRSEPWRGDGPFHYLADLRMADELIRRLGRPCTLVGHSYGAFLAIQLATTLGERIEKLAVWEPVAWGVLYEEGPEGEAFHRDQVERG
ncbi:MAG: alpha/beta hydrolase, partial [Actinobacteria bacterium]|nr:alpha/beta hydrolase [Actinomycetota bacterium]